ncbi:MAG: hypothetical protein M1484_03585 [Patescibacteria group bacterium]|nr:hypothetical protein [Patescibacteria group bacterium]MCL5432144.1 hypothetical protein [Patescibacteria group bacterium]
MTAEWARMVKIGALVGLLAIVVVNVDQPSAWRVENYLVSGARISCFSGKRADAVVVMGVDGNVGPTQMELLDQAAGDYGAKRAGRVAVFDQPEWTGADRLTVNTRLQSDGVVPQDVDWLPAAKGSATKAAELVRLAPGLGIKSVIMRDLPGHVVGKNWLCNRGLGVAASKDVPGGFDLFRTFQLITSAFLDKTGSWWIWLEELLR